MSSIPDKLLTTRIADFATDCVTLDVADFTRKHGRAFLLHWGDLGAPRKAQDLTRTTNIVEPPVTPTRKTLRPQMDFVVFQVRWSGRSPYAHFISVGRTANNDIVIPDDSVSKFHAFFKQDGDRYLLQDAGSKNGTFLDEEMVLSAQVGKPSLLEAGVRVRFGLVDLTFLLAADFCKFVRGVIRNK